VRQGKKTIVKSRTSAGFYNIVDLMKGTCTCEAGEREIRCWHLEAAVMWRLYFNVQGKIHIEIDADFKDYMRRSGEQ